MQAVDIHAGLPGSGLRHVTIFFSDIAGFSDFTRKLGDLEASRLTQRLLTLQEIIITRDELGRVLQFGGDSVFAVFENASVAINRALEVQRVLACSGNASPLSETPQIRIGLHMGEVLVKEGDRLEIISRHVNRAHRVMEAALPGQILASDAVVDAARDFIDLPREHLGIRHYGEYYLKGVGATSLCEVADNRFRKPEAPPIVKSDQAETALTSRLELAGYSSVARLGEGAFGVVYRAQQYSTGKSVAVKVLAPAICEDKSARERFAQEAERTRALNLVRVSHIIEQRLDHQPPFFVMDLIEGRAIDIALAGAGPDRVARVFHNICDILTQAHAAGVIHCDLKPGNILLSADDKPTVMDFGISTLSGTAPLSKTGSTSLLGTPGFVAPEIIQGAKRLPQTDIYSLGVLLYKVLAGREPFTGDTVHQVVQAHLHEDPVPPSVWNPAVADGLQRVCLKALEKRPEERYGSAREMAEDLARFLRGEMVRTRPTAYDNLLFHRVQKHVEEVQDWTARGLLSAEESHRLLSSYEGLQRRGLPAVMEARMFRLWQTLVYVGGWAVVNAALLWLVLHWESLTRAGKLALGSIPAFTTFALAGLMWRAERFRLFFVALVVGVLGTPLLVGVWLHEFEIAAFVPEARRGLELIQDLENAFTNDQILYTAIVWVLVAGAVMAFTRTATHSAQTVLAAFLCYSAYLLRHGLRPLVEQEQWAEIAVRCIPLLIATCAISVLLIKRQDRHYQAPPWIYFSAALLLVITLAIALHGLSEWTELSQTIRKPTSFLLLSLAGVTQAAVGLAARSLLRHRCRLASLGVIFCGLATVLVGFALAGWRHTWPEEWWQITLLGKAVPFPLVALPAAALLISLLACRFQMFVFLLVGLIGLAFSIHLLGEVYFRDVSAWPKGLMMFGAGCFFLALYKELRRTRGNTIDDAVTQIRL